MGMTNEEILARTDWQELYNLQIDILSWLAASRTPPTVTKAEIERLDDLYTTCNQKLGKPFGPKGNKQRKIIKSYRVAMQKGHVNEIEFLGFDEEYDKKKEKQPHGNKNK